MGTESNAHADSERVILWSGAKAAIKYTADCKVAADAQAGATAEADSKVYEAAQGSATNGARLTAVNIVSERLAFSASLIMECGWNFCAEE